MPSYSGTQYLPYVALCLELGRHRDCDLCNGSGGRGAPCPACQGRGWHVPSLADWLDLIQEADSTSAEVGFTYQPGASKPWTAGTPFTHSDGFIYSGEGATREEAAARLWMRLTEHIAWSAEYFRHIHRRF